MALFNPSLERSVSLWREAAIALCGAAIITLGAKIQVPFWPVPMTLHTLAVFFLAAALGPRLGFLAMATYLAAGATGLPVFSGSPERGIGLAYMAGPTGGYLVGYLASTVVIGRLAQGRGWMGQALAMLAGLSVVYAAGLLWLAIFVPASGLIAAGFAPFILGDLIKSALATACVTGLESAEGADVMSCSKVRSNWTVEEARTIHALPLPDLLYRAQGLHRLYFDPTAIETASLLSIKTGGCPEDCGYCSQSAHHQTGVKATKLMDVDAVLAAAGRAKAAGAQRFCMGAAWRSPKDRDMDKLCDMVRGVSKLGLETCMTLGMLSPEQVTRLKVAGLDFYNHNIDTSPDYYRQIATTRTMEDRLETVEHVRKGGIKVCCGGILGMGETEEDRIAMLVTLATLPAHPDSVPINLWNEIEGVPVQRTARPVDPFALVRLVALARVLMPASVVRLSAGRTGMSDELQALCFLAGANSIFVGDQLLTTGNPAAWKDRDLLARLGMHVAPAVRPASLLAGE